jgi:hypothetical protein
MPPTKPPRETPAALQAFEDYWAMGDGRSLRKLAVAYKERTAGGQAVPTRQVGQLFKWSTQHHWEDRVKDRTLEEADLARRKLRARADKQRERIMVGLEVGMARLLQAIDKGEVVLVGDIADLATGAKLYFQVAGEPLTEKTTQEHTGPNGGPVAVVPVPIPVFGPNDPLNHFDQEPQVETDGEAADDG